MTVVLSLSLFFQKNFLPGNKIPGSRGVDDGVVVDDVVVVYVVCFLSPSLSSYVDWFT